MRLRRTSRSILPSRSLRRQYGKFGDTLPHPGVWRKVRLAFLHAICRGAHETRYSEGRHAPHRTIARGKPETRLIKFGDTIQMEVFDGKGRSVFGAIHQRAAHYTRDA